MTKSENIITINNRGELANLLQSVEHEFGQDDNGKYLNTTADFGEGQDANGVEVDVEFVVRLAAEPVKPIGETEGVENTPLNKQFLMTRALNGILEEFEEALTNGVITSLGGNTIVLPYLGE